VFPGYNLWRGHPLHPSTCPTLSGMGAHSTYPLAVVAVETEKL
jgi:hypothetical protein